MIGTSNYINLNVSTSLRKNATLSHSPVLGAVKWFFTCSHMQSSSDLVLLCDLIKSIVHRIAALDREIFIRVSSSKVTTIIIFVANLA
uniref:Uncharacterized protein n=1 Tax=Setaria italica TaxID=4555 RepID=K3Y0E4_SETIT